MSKNVVKFEGQKDAVWTGIMNVYYRTKQHSVFRATIPYRSGIEPMLGEENFFFHGRLTPSTFVEHQFVVNIKQLFLWWSI